MYGKAYFKAYDERGRLVFRSKDMTVDECRKRARWWAEDYGDKVYMFYSSTEAMFI